MKSEQAFTEANTRVFDPAMDIQVENTEQSANFEYHLPAVCEKKIKTCCALASASNVLLTNKKTISSYVGPSKNMLCVGQSASFRDRTVHGKKTERQQSYNGFVRTDLLHIVSIRWSEEESHIVCGSFWRWYC